MVNTSRKKPRIPKLIDLFINLPIKNFLFWLKRMTESNFRVLKKKFFSIAMQKNSFFFCSILCGETVIQSIFLTSLENGG